MCVYPQGPQTALLKKGCPFKRAFALFCPLFAPFLSVSPLFFDKKWKITSHPKINLNVLNNKRELHWTAKRLRNIPLSLFLAAATPACNLVMNCVVYLLSKAKS